MESELDEELRAHLARQTAKYILAGMPRDEAARRARLEFGGLEQVKEECRDARGVNFIETTIQDMRYGLRMLRKNPGFTAVVILSLALGIGANSAMFTVVNAVLLRPLPFRDPGRLVSVDGIPAVEFNGDHTRAVGWYDWVGKTRTLEDVSIYEWGGVNLSSLDEPQRLPAAAVSEGLFRLLGVSPARGRTFVLHDNGPAPLEVVISYDLWQGHLGADPKILGRVLELSGKPFTVVGVMPPGFEFPGDTQVWIPAALNLQENIFAEGGIVTFPLARLRPGSTLDQAQVELEVFLPQMHQGNAAPFNPKVTVTPLHVQLVKDSRPALLVLMGAVGLVLLIACADVANLLMARNVARSREVALRAALGASRGRVVRQLLTESIVLSLAGGALGLLLAEGGARLARALIPPSAVYTSEIRLDGWVLGFTFAVAVLTGVVAGLLPALGSSKLALSETLKGGAASIFGLPFPRQSRLRFIFGMGEIALALILLIGAGLLMKSLAGLSQANPGFRKDHVLTARIFLAGPAYAEPARRADFYERVLERANALPNVRAAAWMNMIPLGEGVSLMYSVGVEGSSTPKPQTSDKWVFYQTASPEYFRAMGIPLIAGRAFDDRDRNGSPRVVIVSATMARRCWPGQDPIGKRITMQDPPQWRTVVGVVGDVRGLEFSNSPDMAMYFPILQEPPKSAFLVFHTSGPVAAADMARCVRAVDRGIPLASVNTMEQLLSRETAEPRFRAIVLGLFSALALLLATVGTYGIMSYSVGQRRHEIGIRMALGAERRDVLGMILKQGLSLAGLGVAAGLAGALALTRLLAGFLYGVRPTEFSVFSSVSLGLAAVVLIAVLIPARRAVKVDPMVALRYE